jgi:hypothetical protein
MTVPAAECRLALRQQFERAVVARSHAEHGNKLANKAPQRQHSRPGRFEAVQKIPLTRRKPELSRLQKIPSVMLTLTLGICSFGLTAFIAVSRYCLRENYHLYRALSTSSAPAD